MTAATRIRAANLVGILVSRGGSLRKAMKARREKLETLIAAAAVVALVVPAHCLLDRDMMRRRSCAMGEDLGLARCQKVWA